MISAFETNGLAVERGGRLLFEDLSFRLSAGEALAVTGPNGAGKTSLLRCIAGLLRPAAGAVAFLGSDGAAQEPGASRAAHLHWLGSQDGLKGQRTVEQELEFWTRWNGGPSAPDALKKVGLADQRRTEIRRLSSGQRRRLALARLLAAPRAIWLLDEPLAPLDAAWRATAGEFMRDQLQRGGMIVAAVHDPLPIPARTLALIEAG